MRVARPLLTLLTDRPNNRARNIIILAFIVAGWLLLDQLTKHYFNGFAVGDDLGVLIPGVIDLTLVHNTGSAWGMFSDMTGVLAVISVVVCLVAIGYLIVVPDASALAAVGLSLVVAGGIGNAVDRFVNGYVIDFLDFSFMDFPVFNVADIGVTYGVIMFIVAIAADWLDSSMSDESPKPADASADGASNDKQSDEAGA